MKFAASIALLASVAAALPTGSTSTPTKTPTGLPSGFPHGMPTGMPSEMPTPSGVPAGVPSGIPSGIPSGLPSGLPADAPAPSAVPSGIPSGVVPSMSTIAPTSVPTGSVAGFANLITITDKAKKDIQVAVLPEFATQLLALKLPLTQSLGKIIGTNKDFKALGADPASGLIVVQSEGTYALVQVFGEALTLVKSLAHLPLLGQPLGTVTGIVGTILKRDDTGIMSITDEANKLVPVKLDQDILKQLDAPLTGQGNSNPLGSVLASAPAADDLKSTISKLAVDPTQVFSVLSADHSTKFLVKLGDQVSGLTKLVTGLTDVLSKGPAGSPVGSITSL